MLPQRFLVALSVVALINANSLRLPIRRNRRKDSHLEARLQSNETSWMDLPLEDRLGHYEAGIWLGTPPRQFHVAVDTGSYVTWVAGADCVLAGVRLNSTEPIDPTREKCWGRVFRPQLSATAVELNRTKTMKYGKGGMIGKYYQDIFGLGDEQKLIDSVSFVVAEFVDPVGEMDGLLGLVRNRHSAQPTVLTSFLETRLFEPPQFTVWLGNLDENEGLLVFGDSPEEHCGPTLVTVPTARLDFAHWTMLIDAIDNGHIQLTDRLGIVDTGGTFLSIPPQDFQRLFPNLNSSDAFPCDSPPDPGVELHFRLHDHTFHFWATDLLWELWPGACVWGIRSAGLDGFWVLGDVFMRKLCVTHNYEDLSLGFAEALHSMPETTTGGDLGESTLGDYETTEASQTSTLSGNEAF